MAQVPNYYYNSPWIADAARSFASALAPPDPDKLREREQNQFEFDYLKRKAANEETDRAGNEVARGALGELHKIRANPIFKLDPAGNPLIGKNGKPILDADEMDRRSYELADVVMKNATDARIRDDLEQALFEASPKFRRQQLVQKVGIAAAAQRLATQNQYRTDQLYVQGGIQSALQAQEDAAAMMRLQTGAALKLKEWQLRGTLAAKSKNTTPLTITQPLINAVGMRFRQLERVAGYPLSDDDRLLFTGEAMDRLQETRNPVGAADAVWAAHGLSVGGTSPTTEVAERDSFINWLMEMTDANFDATTSGPGQTDTVLAPTPAATPTAANVVPGSLGAASITQPVVSPDEAYLTDRFYDNARDATARMKPPGQGGKKTPPKGAPKNETPEQRKARLRKMLEGKD